MENAPLSALNRSCAALPASRRHPLREVICGHAPLLLAAILRRMVLVLVLALAMVSPSAQATPLSGTKTVGPTGDYASLTAALADIQTQTLGGPLVLELQSSYVSSVETFPLTFSNLGTTATNTLTVRPQAGATGLSISGADITAATVDLNGAQFVTFDGRPAGAGTAKQLTIANTDVNGISVRFINEASGNTLQYLVLRGVNGSPVAGTICFSITSGANGNDGNTIDHCDIGDGASPPVNCIFGLGTTNGTAAQYNSGNIISNCNIFNFAPATAIDASGIRLEAGNTAWIISGNSFFQTANRAAVSATTRAIYINTPAGDSYTISGNAIGGGAPGATGTAWSNNGLATSAFVGIQIGASNTAPSSVQGNTVTNMFWINSGATTALPGIWCGIDVAAGRVDVGTTTGNVIGAATGNDSITVTAGGSGGTTFGIGSVSAATVNIANNSIGSITTNGVDSSTSASLIGIQVTNGTNSISNNLVGSLSTTNSLNAATASTSNTGQGVTGIFTSSSTSTNITGNTVANLNNEYTGNAASGQIRGIVTGSNSSGVNTIGSNIVHHLSTPSQNAGVNANTAVLGIADFSTVAGQTISQNTVYALSNTAASAQISVVGFSFTQGTTTGHLYARNLVHSLSASTTGFTATSGVTGMLFATGFFTAQNNMIRLGLDINGNSTAGGTYIRGINDNAGGATNARNFYHNSVYIGGTQTSGSALTYAILSAGTTNIRDYRNNIFTNNRGNSGGTGKHYAVNFGGTATNLTSNNNIFFANGTGGVLGFFNSLDQTTLSAWQSATGKDGSSKNADPLFKNATGAASILDLHLLSTSPARKTGTGLPAVTNDFDGQGRNSVAPDMGADEISANATLTNLALSNGSLTPDFDSGTFSYTVTVPNAVSSISVTPTAGDAEASITVNNVPVSSGVASGSIALSAGSNSINVALTSQDLLNNLTYTITVTREGGMTPFQQWASNNGVGNNPSTPGANGLPNLLNFAFSMNPASSNSGGLVYNGSFFGGSGTIGATGQPITRQEGSDIRALFVRRTDYLSAGLTYTVQFSPGLSSWQDSTDTPVVLADDGTNQIVSVPYPAGFTAAGFFKVNLSMP